jgi:hypothetical protein
MAFIHRLIDPYVLPGQAYAADMEIGAGWIAEGGKDNTEVATPMVYVAGKRFSLTGARILHAIIGAAIAEVEAVEKAKP